MVRFPCAKILILDIEKTFVYLLLFDFKSALFQVLQNGLFFVDVESKDVLDGEEVFVLDAGEIELEFGKFDFG